MNSHVMWNVSRARSAGLRINLVISPAPGDRFLVQFGPGGPWCPSFAWPNTLESIDRLGPAIEAAASAALRIRVEFVEILAFVGSNLFVLVTCSDSIPGVEAVPVGDLAACGVRSDLVQVYQAAADLMFTRRFAADLSVRLQQALAKAVKCLEQAVAVEEGRAGWSVDLSHDRVGVMSSAEGLLTLVHANVRSQFIEPAGRCLEEAQNADGGWQVRYSLIGPPNGLSITESTCFALWALAEVGRSADGRAISSGAAWLFQAQDESGGWRTSEQDMECRVIATAFAVRVLSRLCLYPQAVTRGLRWLLAAQVSIGGWGYVSGDGTGHGEPAVAPTAHAVIGLLAAGLPKDHVAVVRGCDYLRARFNPTGDQAPWPSAVSSTNVDKNSKLHYRHFATPWALIALILAGNGLSDMLVQHGLNRLLQLQEPDGVWLDPAFANQPQLWAVHDAVYAVRTVLSLSAENLRQIALEGHRDQADRIRESVILGLVAEQGPRSRWARRR